MNFTFMLNISKAFFSSGTTGAQSKQSKKPIGSWKKRAQFKHGRLRPSASAIQIIALSIFFDIFTHFLLLLLPTPADDAIIHSRPINRFNLTDDARFSNGADDVTCFTHSRRAWFISVCSRSLSLSPSLSIYKIYKRQRPWYTKRKWSVHWPVLFTL